jgi:hypothetical protein
VGKGSRNKRLKQSDQIVNPSSSASISDPELPKVHPLLVVFVVLHLVAITFYTLPKPMPAVMNGSVPPKGADAFLKFNCDQIRESAPFAAYLHPTGMWQYWDMFAPEPSSMDLWASAEVQYFDGTKVDFKYPRIKDLGLIEKYHSERYRKFFERVNPDEYRYFWAPFAQTIALKSAKNPKNPPVRVAIIRHFAMVTRHDAKNNKIDAPYNFNRFYIHVVDQENLFRRKGWSRPARGGKRGKP